MIACPACQQPVREADINRHLDSECKQHVANSQEEGGDSGAEGTHALPSLATQSNRKTSQKAADFFTPVAKKVGTERSREDGNAAVSVALSSPLPPVHTALIGDMSSTAPPAVNEHSTKRAGEHTERSGDGVGGEEWTSRPTKRAKLDSHAPLAERMRPRSLDDVVGQKLVGKDGVLRDLIQRERVPSMILWGGPGTGKTTIARLLAHSARARFVEINSTASGVAECKRLFAEARSELGLTGRKTIIFCDEIHRFSKSQQDVFLGPVEAGLVVLIGATTENPSFKVQSALLSRCRTFTLEKLSKQDVFEVLQRAMSLEVPVLPTPTASPSFDGVTEQTVQPGSSLRPAFHLLTHDDHALLHYLAAFADGDARTGLNLLELALQLCQRPNITVDEIKKSLTQTLVYDRAGDQHYDTISAFHKSVRGSDPDAALYYLARMLQSGEDPLYVARRMVVIASEDVGLADNSMISLATAAYTAAEKIGMPECRINLAHCAVALCLAPKSVRAYRGLNAAYAALAEPGIAGLPVPIHLRNAPTRLMKELGYGKSYKYNPDFHEGKVAQQYLPEALQGRRFLGDRDLGVEVDADIPANEGHVHDSGVSGEYGELLLGPDGD